MELALFNRDKKNILILAINGIELKSPSMSVRDLDKDFVDFLLNLDFKFSPKQQQELSSIFGHPPSDEYRRLKMKLDKVIQQEDLRNRVRCILCTTEYKKCCKRYASCCPNEECPNYEEYESKYCPMCI